MAAMEHPVFSISTKPDRRIRRYENGDKFIEITPSVKGVATVHDRDILIFCISQVIAAYNEGRPIEQRVRFKARDFLAATNRGLDGRGYEQFVAALERLRGTTITTNIVTGGVEQTRIFGLVESADIVREGRDGRMQDIEVRLSDWVFNAIKEREVLTLHRNYFRLRKPLERRLYEIARKHCGQASEWRIGLPKLRLKCGSASTDKEFRRLVTKITDEDATHDHIPDYRLTFDDKKDQLVVTNRNTMKRIDAYPEWIKAIHFDGDTYDEAREAAPGWDPYFIEQEWRDWLANSAKPPPRKPELAFIRFCATFYERRGAP
ncbi:replication initiator protein A (plasmid) [Acuticoccus sp. MNP-M23]|uniref:replication initiator protein A n=1 Tax=Acuticoccus sp. MNP-M23 TaxID=3072793 RepID=UPI002815501B|nr:replication initiator protein A [Acuticoccus sp. MNP-M23]WMS45252.1 replication initiator protein A [Acuticoccus sp. MNP-M23]